jgi:hypothetical protein
MADQEQAKREAGASRKSVRRQRIDVTLSQEVIDFLDDQPVSRSRFLEMITTQLPEFAAWQQERNKAMATVKIERNEYDTGIYNRHTAVSWKAHIEDDLTGEWLAEAPARDTYEQAQDDAHLFREQLRERSR